MTAQLGSISSDTLRVEDLLSAFAHELDYQVRRAADLSPEECYRLHALAEEARGIEDFESDKAADLVGALQDELEAFAPPYAYFGTHEGDGACFGYWPDMDAIDELPRVSDPGEVEQHAGEDCVFVNDHGNVTVYGGDGRVIWDIV